MNAKLFFKSIRISVLLIMFSAITQAATETFVVTDDPGYAPYTNHFKLRNGTDATIGLKVQRIVSGSSANNKYAAPTTNIVLDAGNTNININIYGNALPADCQDYEACRAWMGDDDAATAAGDAGNAGMVSGLIGSSDTSRQGWLRAFSSTRITNSAYYGDAKKADTALANAGEYNYEWNPSNPAISNVNPAYTIPIDSTPTNGPTYGSVIGSVFATTSGGNNQLESGYILIEWRYENSSSWTTGDSSLDANGNFNFTVTVPKQTNIFVRARVKNVNTPRDGFPFSSEFLVTVTATPATPVVTITNPNGGSDYTVNIGLHSTNIVGTVDSIPDSLVWSNSLNNSGGTLTPATSFDFSTALILGVNPITVYATKSGITGNNSITITVNNPPAPTVNITTGNILTNAWPVNVSGTSTGADYVLLSNTVTGTTYPCTGTDNWSVNITGTDNTAENYVAVAVNIGGSTVSSPIEIDHDDIPPTVGQISPLNNYTGISANVTFTFTAVDDRHSIASTEINFDGSGWKNFISGSSEAFTEGIHTWEVRATDDVGSGNTSAPSGTRTFYVYEPPTVAFVNPVSSGTYNTNGAVNMTVPIDGTVTAGSTVILSNTTTATEYSTMVAGGTWNVAAVALARGNNILVVRAKRNNVDSAPAQITINNQEPGAPVVTITAPNGGSDYTVNIGHHSTNIVGTVDSIPDTLVWSNSLNNSGGTLTPATSFDFNAALILGVNPITVYATKSGVTGNDTISITVNNPPAPTAAITTSNILTNAWPVNVSGTSTGANSVLLSNTVTGTTYPCTGTDNWSVNITGTDNTAENYVAVAVNIGGYTVSSTIEIDHDDIPPTVGQISPLNNYTGTSANVTFTFTAVDDRHSVASTEINFDGLGWKNFISGSSEAFTEGIHTWEVRATDDVGSGNTSAPSGTRTFYVYEPPTVAFVNPVSSGTYNTNGAVNMTVPVDGTVTAGSTVILSNTTTATEYSANVVSGTWDVAAVVLARGNNILVVRAKRNDVDSAPAQITINNQEPEVPVVTITDPNGGSDYTVNIGPHSTNIVGTVNLIPDSLVWSNSITTAGGTLTSATSFDISVDLSVGTNLITIYATKSGVTGSDNISIVVTTNEDLSVTITAPNNGEHYIALLGMHTTNILGTVTGNPDSVVWSNSLTGTGGSLGAVSSFDIPVLLTNGQNNITVLATKNGETKSDFIIIGVAEPGELLLIITAPNLGDSYSITNESSTNISGIISYVPDSLNWTNSLTGDNGALILSNRFDFQANLETGDNAITVSAAKGVQQYNDSITITVNEPVNPEPYIKVISPTNWMTYSSAQLIDIAGVATDNVAVVAIFRNGTDITSQYTPPDWTDSRYIGLGTNTFTYIAVDGDGNSATDIVNYIVIDNSHKIPPLIEVTAPADWTVYSVPTDIHVFGIATDNFAIVSITRNGIDITSGYSQPNWTDNITANLLSIGTNSFSYIAVDGDGNSATDIVRYVVISDNTNTVSAQVLETWPRFIGNGQTGTIEFISANNTNWSLFVINDASSNTPVATGLCTTGWNLIDFYGGNLPIINDNNSNILQLVIGDDGSNGTLRAGAVTVVGDLNTLGAPSTDFDNDSIYIKYKSKYGGKCEAKGRTLYITGGSPNDKLIVRVKAAPGGDGVAAICGIISESGLNKIKTMGDIDRLQLDGLLGTLMIKGGSLGRPNNSLRYNVRFNSFIVKSKTKIMLKAGKNNTTKIVIPANIYANILAGELESEPNDVKELAGLKMIKIIGGNLGVEYDEISKTTYRHWLNAKYIDIIMVKPKSKIYGGKTFDYSFYFTGENKIGKGSFKKMYFYYGTEDSSDNKQDNISIVCGYDNNNLNPVEITGTNWIGQNVSFGFDKIMTKAGELQGTVVLKNWIKGKTRQVKGTDDARWIVNGKEE